MTAKGAPAMPAIFSLSLAIFLCSSFSLSSLSLEQLIQREIVHNAHSNKTLNALAHLFQVSGRHLANIFISYILRSRRQ